jgi:signal transduction histidine kinase
LKGNILIVDDTPENLKVLSAMLAKQGYKIRPAINGKIALQLARLIPPDLILLDIMMPEMDGYEVCRHLKADEKTRNIPIIFLSALSETFDKVKAFSAGGVDYVTKPFHTAEVLARIETHSSLRDLQKRLEEKNKLLEQEIVVRKGAEEAAQAANRAKSTFLSNMSHELRTPLNGILGYAQILQRERNLTSTQIDGLNIIQKSGHHLLTLINDILDLAKIEAGKLALYPTAINLPNFLDGVVSIMQMVAQQKALQFIFDVPKDLPVAVEADEKRFRQVLLNLLGNAVKFTDKGSITLRVLCVDKKWGSIRFEVQDTGVGMTPEQAQKIFQPFEQVGDEKKQREGTGLGLSITYQLVTLMGGDLKVSSVPGKGSTFWFEIHLPVLEEANLAQETVENKQVTGYQGERHKILIVDDQVENRQVLLDLLKPLGFDITLASNGKEGVEQALAIHPNLILMDLVMPVMNGFEAVRAIRKIHAINNLPIIAVSASIFERDQRKSQNIGCQGFLSKPVESNKLFAMMEKYMGVKWFYETVIPITKPLETPMGELIPPPLSELEILYELTMFGNLERIQEKSLQLENMDAKYVQFAYKLREHAKNFEDEPILALLESFMK